MVNKRRIILEGMHLYDFTYFDTVDTADESQKRVKILKETR